MHYYSWTAKKDRTNYELSNLYLTRAIEYSEGGPQVGKAYYTLARLIESVPPLPRRPLAILDKGIEYAKKAIDKEEHRALYTCERLYQLRNSQYGMPGDRQMAASYFYQSICKGFQKPKILKRYFTFEKPKDQGASSGDDGMDQAITNLVISYRHLKCHKCRNI